MAAAGNLTRAVWVAKFTVAAIPLSRLSLRSILAAQEAQVIPPIDSSAVRTSPASGWAGRRVATVLMFAPLLYRPPAAKRGAARLVQRGRDGLHGQRRVADDQHG